MANGKWQMANGKWQMAKSEGTLFAIFHLPFAITPHAPRAAHGVLAPEHSRLSAGFSSAYTSRHEDHHYSESKTRVRGAGAVGPQPRWFRRRTQWLEPDQGSQPVRRRRRQRQSRADPLREIDRHADTDDLVCRVLRP